MSIYTDAIMILRVLEEKGIIGGYSMKIADIMAFSDLNEDSYNKADDYLLENGYIEGASGGPNASRWLTGLGVNHLEQEMARRLPLSIKSERILNYIISSATRPLEAIPRSKIITALKLDNLQYDSAVQNLLDFELAQRGGGVAVVSLAVGETHRSEDNLRATQAGRQAARRGYSDPQLTTQTSQVFNIHAPSNIQAVASAINSQIEQQVQQSMIENDPDALKEAISELLKGLVELVCNDLTLSQQAEYIKTAADINEELNKSDPEAEAIQRWIARLAFLDKAFTVGEKAISLSSKVLPTIMMLVKIVEILLGK